MQLIVPPTKFKQRTNSVKTTRHTIYTFLPIRLFKEFTKSFNLFFLFLCCVVLIPNFTPFSSVSYIACVAMVISVNIVKHALSELKRYRADKEVNNELFPVIRKGVSLDIRRADINLGEILIVKPGVVLPMDVLVLGVYTRSGTQRHVYIETSSLDGENALKKKRPLLELGRSGELAEEDLEVLSGVQVVRREGMEGELEVRLSREGGREGESGVEVLGFSEESMVWKGCSVYGEYEVVG
ncbi:hypothetical protein NEHOM01_0003, partial [Nematocida homosporus]|uniref:uncharacterized protein n=1 Tax=Nematocida homosporus TaxID=1912981 RepID=UPI00221FC894